MDKLEKLDDENATAGVIVKAGNVSTSTVTDEELAKINEYTLEPLENDEVFTFKVMAGTNRDDDRNYMPFSKQSIVDMVQVYKGITMIQDHRRQAGQQIARVYDTEMKETDEMLPTGERFAQLILKCYMVKTSGNEDLIAEIKAGIKKEVSTSTVPKKLVCNICGVDNMEKYCQHYPRVKYRKRDSEEYEICKLTIDGVKEAHEISFVAVPAQPTAGTTKCVGFKKPIQEVEEPVKVVKNDDKSELETALNIELAGVSSFLYKNAKNESEEI